MKVYLNDSDESISECDQSSCEECSEIYNSSSGEDTSETEWVDTDTDNSDSDYELPESDSEVSESDNELPTKKQRII
jgi:hypothetical protein